MAKQPKHKKDTGKSSSSRNTESELDKILRGGKPGLLDSLALEPGSNMHSLLTPPQNPRAPIQSILKAGPQLASEGAPSKDKDAELIEELRASEDEKRRAGELLNAFFGEYNTAMRSYAFAKNTEESPEIMAFMENPNPELEDNELRRLGWGSFKKLMSDLSMPVYHREQARKEGNFAEEDVDSETEASEKILRNKIIPRIREHEDQHGLFNLGASEEERMAEVRKQAPGYALVVEAMMHNDKTRGLYAAIHKETFGEPLTDKDRKLIEDNPDVVDGVRSVLCSVGLGYATVPCNQIHREANHAAEKWGAFMKEENQALKALGEGSNFIAKTHMQNAMEHHRESLESYRLIHEALGPVCKRVESVIDSNGKANLNDEILDRVVAMAKSLPEMCEKEPRISYNRSRLVSAVKSLKPGSAEMNLCNGYFHRGETINSYAATTGMSTEKLLADIE